MTINKGGTRKRNQAPFEVFGFRLFDKVKCNGEIGFIFGRRASGSFDIRKLDGTKISAGISYKKLTLISKRRSLICERREAAIPPRPIEVGVSLRQFDGSLRSGAYSRARETREQHGRALQGGGNDRRVGDG